jgi:hypothetical protein
MISRCYTLLLYQQVKGFANVLNKQIRRSAKKDPKLEEKLAKLSLELVSTFANPLFFRGNRRNCGYWSVLEKIMTFY